MNINHHTCRHHEVMICKGRGPHQYQLKCVPCNKHIQWLSAKSALHLIRDMNIAQNKIRAKSKVSTK